MTEHVIFSAMVFGPVTAACLGILLLVISYLAYRDERKKKVPIRKKLYRRVIVAGILLVIPGIVLLLAKLTVMLRPR